MLVVGHPLSQLKAAVANRKVQALAPSTRKNLETQYKTYLFFCLFFNVAFRPFQLEVLEIYAEYLGQWFKAPGSIKNYIFGLQTLAHLKSWEFPDISGPGFKYLLKGISKNLAHVPSRAAPISPLILLHVFKFFNLSDPYEASAWAVMVLGFLLFARLSNLLPSSSTKFERNQQLTRSDVRVAQDSVVVSLKWSKTRQCFDRIHQVPLSAQPGSPLCPKQALLQMVRLSKSGPNDHLFSYSSPQGLGLMSQSEFVKFFRNKLSLACYDPQVYSGHSFRRGGATWAFLSGVPSESIKNHGDWRSDAYQVYLDPSLSQRLCITKSMFQSI